MKVTVTKENFADALEIAHSATSTRAAHPVLTTLRLTAKDGKLELTGCDGEMWAIAAAAANVEDEGGICLSANLLNQIVNSLSAGDIVVEVQGTSAVLRHGKSEWKMMAFPSEEFPDVPEVSPTSELELEMNELRRAVDSVAYAVCDDPSRPVLTGVLFNYDGQTLTLVATDTHRLAVNQIEREGIGSSLSVVVPNKALRSLRTLNVADDEKIKVSFDDQRLFLDVGTAKITAQLLSGNYPNWERVVPNESTRSWTMDREEFMENVNRALILAKDNAYRVRFACEDETLVISARSEDKGEGREEVGVVSNNGNLEIAFNGRYVKEALQAFETEGVKAEMTESSRPAIFRPVDASDGRFCVIMPMALG
jgi:DNA polymerase-3 subunit beta